MCSTHIGRLVVYPASGCTTDTGKVCRVKTMSFDSGLFVPGIPNTNVQSMKLWTTLNSLVKNHETKNCTAVYSIYVWIG